MTDANTIRLMREASGMGMMDCKDAARMADEEFDGDLVMGLLVRDAHGLAINVRSRGPDVSDAEARHRWDVEHALSARDAIRQRSEAWRVLDDQSPRWKDKRA